MESNATSIGELNILENTELLPWLKESVLNDSCDVLFVVTDKILELAEEDESLKDNLLKAEAIFPSSNIKIGDNGENEEYENVEDSIEDVDTCNINEEFMAQIIDEADSDKLDVMILTNDVAFANTCRTSIDNTLDNFNYIGEYVFEEEIDDDLVINDINAHLPDIVFCAFDSPLQEQWIIENKSKMNIKLCVALSGDAKDVLMKKGTNVKWIARLFGKQGMFGLNVL